MLGKIHRLRARGTFLEELVGKMDEEAGTDEKWQADEEARRAKMGATADPWDDDKVST